ETTVVSITGNGLKTTDAIRAEFPASEAIAPRLEAFEAYLDTQMGATAAAKAGSRATMDSRVSVMSGLSAESEEKVRTEDSLD
ncbi:MAG TPA: hypothetical protein VM709_07845, partial [Candidatus Sulfotelmatobacter sp.]|nr:hypothetical protein [Candidatus Sulfotelmatobacter sp.]